MGGERSELRLEWFEFGGRQPQVPAEAVGDGDLGSHVVFQHERVHRVDGGQDLDRCVLVSGDEGGSCRLDRPSGEPCRDLVAALGSEHRRDAVLEHRGVGSLDLRGLGEALGFGEVFGGVTLAHRLRLLPVDRRGKARRHEPVSVAQHPIPEVPVFGTVGHGLVEPTGRSQHCRLRDRRVHVERAVVPGRDEVDGRLRPGPPGPVVRRCRIVRGKDRSPEHPGDLGRFQVRGEGSDPVGQRVLGEQVVAVEERDEFTCGEEEAGVAGCGQPPVAGVAHHADPLVGLGGVPRRRDAVVGGGVVDDDALPGAVGLALHRFEA